MTERDAKCEIIKYWIEKADDAIASAKSEMAAKRFTFAMNRAYYACFYSASAALMGRGFKFTKHSGVRSAVHQQLVKKGLISDEYGKIYDRMFENRQEGDYLELVEFEQGQLEQSIDEAARFVEKMKSIIVS